MAYGAAGSLTPAETLIHELVNMRGLSHPVLQAAEERCAERCRALESQSLWYRAERLLRLARTTGIFR